VEFAGAGLRQRAHAVFDGAAGSVGWVGWTVVRSEHDLLRTQFATSTVHDTIRHVVGHTVPATAMSRTFSIAVVQSAAAR
jgi:hypothetical protein